MNDDMNDAKLDAILRRRAAPQAPAHLDAHIIAMAARTPQDGRMGAQILKLKRPWFTELLQLFVLPKPAYAFSAVLLVGLVVGLDMGASADDAASVTDWTNLFASGENWL